MVVWDSRTLLALLCVWLGLLHISSTKPDLLGGSKVLLRWSEDSAESYSCSSSTNILTPLFHPCKSD